MFAFSPVLGNYVYAEINLFFLGAKKNAIMIFRLLFGATRWAQPPNWPRSGTSPTSRWDSWPLVNLVAIVLLGKWAFAAIRDYHRQSADGSDPVFVAEQAGLPGALEGDIWSGEARLAAGVTYLRRFGLWTYFAPRTLIRQPRGLSLRTALPGCQRERHRAGVRMHYLDEGPRDGKPVVLRARRADVELPVPHHDSAAGAAGIGCWPPTSSGSAARQADPARDYTYLRHVEWVTSWLTQLDLREITVVVQDWGSLIGLRVAAEQSDRFAKLFIANGFLQTGDRPPTGHSGSGGRSPGTAPWFTASRIVNTGTVHEAVHGRAPATTRRSLDKTYQAGARAFPQLVPTTRRSGGANRAAWKALGRWEKPVLCVFGAHDAILGKADGPLIRPSLGRLASRTPGSRPAISSGRTPVRELVQRLLDWEATCDPAHKRA